MQYRKTFGGFNYCTCFQLHVSAAREHALIGLANGLVANHGSFPGDEDCTGLVQRNQGFDVSPIEGVEEERMNILRFLRCHQVS